jgi:hypothetical protein
VNGIIQLWWRKEETSVEKEADTPVIKPRDGLSAGLLWGEREEE